MPSVLRRYHFPLGLLKTSLKLWKILLGNDPCASVNIEATYESFSLFRHLLNTEAFMKFWINVMLVLQIWECRPVVKYTGCSGAFGFWLLHGQFSFRVTWSPWETPSTVVFHFIKIPHTQTLKGRGKALCIEHPRAIVTFRESPSKQCFPSKKLCCG